MFSRNSIELGYCDQNQKPNSTQQRCTAVQKKLLQYVLCLKKRNEKNVENLEDAQLIEATHSSWAAPSILVNEKDGSLRLVVVYRGLNKQI